MAVVAAKEREMTEETKRTKRAPLSVEEHLKALRAKKAAEGERLDARCLVLADQLEAAAEVRRRAVAELERIDSAIEQPKAEESGERS
jgi:hypothetical protein